MAEKAEDIVNDEGHGDQKFRIEVYEQLWSIPDWDRVQLNSVALSCQTFEFVTGKPTQVQTKWLMGIGISGSSGRGRKRYHFRVFWKLIDAKGFPEGKIQATKMLTFLRADSSVHSTDSQDNTMVVGEVAEVPETFGFHTDWEQCKNPNGELVFKIKLTIKEPLSPINLKMEQFHKTSIVQLGVNFGSLLGDESTADLKIRTSDEKELIAHKAILKAQCPVFETMFHSDLSGNQTGSVDVKDVDSKTMGILLHYFYTGNLLPSWKDEDTIVEFTDAVGKYQLTNVLKLLDEVLGSRDEEDATNTDIQLLDLVQKLGLQTAEKELVERITKTTSKIKSAKELFALYGIKQQKRRDFKTIDSK